MPRTPEQEEQDGFIRGYHDIPDTAKLENLSFIELSLELASCNKESPKFAVVEREIKKHLAKDQAKINRFNICLGACIGGVFGLAGVALGYYLKEVALSSPVRYIEKNDLADKLPVTKVIEAPPTSKPTETPDPIRNNAQPSKQKP